MLTDTLKRLFTRDLNKLKTEISAYRNEASLWHIDKDVINSGGNLCLHVVGNLNHFIGNTLGGTDYVRKRDLEFSLKHVPRSELLRQIEDVIQVISEVLAQLTTDDLQQEYKRRVLEDPMTTEYFLVHLAMHLDYHLGQINYHRRLMDTQ